MTHTTEQLEAMLTGANARADQARDAALVEAAGVANKAMCKFALATYQNDEGRMQNAASTYCADEIRVEILALRDKPAPGVTVQDAARVLLGTMKTDRTAFDAMVEQAELTHGAGASFNKVIGNALRAIAGGEK